MAKNIIDAIVINGMIYNRVEATNPCFSCDECDLEEICSNDSNISLVCEYASEGNYIWKNKRREK